MYHCGMGLLADLGAWWKGGVDGYRESRAESRRYAEFGRQAKQEREKRKQQAKKQVRQDREYARWLRSGDHHGWLPSGEDYARDQRSGAAPPQYQRSGSRHPQREGQDKEQVRQDREYAQWLRTGDHYGWLPSGEDYVRDQRSGAAPPQYQRSGSRHPQREGQRNPGAELAGEIASEKLAWKIAREEYSNLTGGVDSNPNNAAVVAVQHAALNAYNKAKQQQEMSRRRGEAEAVIRERRQQQGQDARVWDIARGEYSNLTGGVDSNVVAVQRAALNAYNNVKQQQAMSHQPESTKSDGMIAQALYEELNPPPYEELNPPPGAEGNGGTAAQRNARGEPVESDAMIAQALYEELNPPPYEELNPRPGAEGNGGTAAQRNAPAPPGAGVNGRPQLEMVEGPQRASLRGLTPGDQDAGLTPGDQDAGLTPGDQDAGRHIRFHDDGQGRPVTARYPRDLERSPSPDGSSSSSSHEEPEHLPSLDDETPNNPFSDAHAVNPSVAQQDLDRRRARVQEGRSPAVSARADQAAQLDNSNANLIEL
jgi:hypothetical protein